MKMRISVFLVVMFCLGGVTAISASLPEGPKLPQQIIKPGDLNGSLSNSAGKKMANASIEILDAEGNVMKTAKTDKNGLYRIRDLKEGDYVMKVNGKQISKLKAAKTGTVTTFSAVMPAAVKVITPLQWTLIAVGGAAVAVGVPIAVHNDSSSSHTISP